MPCATSHVPLNVTSGSCGNSGDSLCRPTSTTQGTECRLAASATMCRPAGAITPPLASTACAPTSTWSRQEQQQAVETHGTNSPSAVTCGAACVMLHRQGCHCGTLCTIVHAHTKKLQTQAGLRRQEVTVRQKQMSNCVLAQRPPACCAGGASLMGSRPSGRDLEASVDKPSNNRHTSQHGFGLPHIPPTLSPSPSPPFKVPAVPWLVTYLVDARHHSKDC